MPLPSSSLLPSSSTLPGTPSGSARPPLPVIEVT
jgi:hypothetical protein